MAVRVRLGGVPGPRRRSYGLLAASGQVRRRGGLLAIQCSRIEKFGIAAAHWTLAAKCTAKRMLTCGDAWTTNASASAAMRIASVMSPGPTDIGLAHDSASGPQELSAWQTMLLVTGPHTQDLRFPLRLQLARLVLPDPSAQQVPM